MREKLDNEKVRLDLVDPEFINAIGEILSFGAKKYEPNAWKEIDNPIDRYYAALLRHLFEWRAGRKKDKESGMPVLWHAACNLMFLNWHDKKKRRQK